jgi:hypothetical protein
MSFILKSDCMQYKRHCWLSITENQLSGKLRHVVIAQSDDVSNTQIGLSVNIS